MSEDRTNGFKELALERVRKGEETLESLERKLELGKDTKTFQDVKGGVKAAIETLKSSK